MAKNIIFDTSKMTKEMRDLFTKLAGLVDGGDVKSVADYFKPEYNEEFFFIDPIGGVGRTAWDDDCEDEEMLSLGNCFRSEEEAEFMVEKLKVTAELLHYAADHNEPMDWNDFDEKKYKPAYNFQSECLDPTWCKRKATGGVYFSSYELCLEACEAVGAERVAKYFLGVDDLR